MARIASPLRIKKFNACTWSLSVAIQSELILPAGKNTWQLLNPARPIKQQREDISTRTGKAWCLS